MQSLNASRFPTFRLSPPDRCRAAATEKVSPPEFARRPEGFPGVRSLVSGSDARLLLAFPLA
eukprot:9466711-Pyramimonas_sp.AAC.1